MHDAAGAKEFPVALQEKRRTEAGVLAAAQLRVRESEPDLRDLPRAEESVDELDAGAQESHVGESVLSSILGPFPEPGAFDIHADIIDLRVPEGQGDGVVSLAAAQLQHDRMVVPEHLLPPSAFDGMVPEPQLPGTGLLIQYGRGIRLHQAAESLVLGKFLQFPMSHKHLFYNVYVKAQP